MVSRSLAIGYRRNMGFIGGMVLGDLVLLGLAISGLAAVATVLGDAFAILTFLAAGYRLDRSLSKLPTFAAGPV